MNVLSARIYCPNFTRELCGGLGSMLDLWQLMCTITSASTDLGKVSSQTDPDTLTVMAPALGETPLFIRQQTYLGVQM